MDSADRQRRVSAVARAGLMDVSDRQRGSRDSMNSTRANEGLESSGHSRGNVIRQHFRQLRGIRPLFLKKGGVATPERKVSARGDMSPVSRSSRKAEPLWPEAILPNTTTFMHRGGNPTSRRHGDFGWKNVSVFVSSTFVDMHAERDLITGLALRRAERRLQDDGYKVRIRDIDLRWGITGKESEAGLAAEICLELVTRCRPFFVGLLGRRYGYQPGSSNGRPYGINTSVPLFHCLRDFPPNRSITELEMFLASCPYYAADGVTVKNPHVLVYERDDSFMRSKEFLAMPESERKMFEQSPERVEAIRRNLFARGFKLRKYAAKWNAAPVATSLNGTGDFETAAMSGRVVVDLTPNECAAGTNPLADMIANDLVLAIKAEYPKPEGRAPDDVERTRMAHAAFAEELASTFVGREETLSRMHHFVAKGCLAKHRRTDGSMPGDAAAQQAPSACDGEANSKRRILVISARPGAGKTAVMARFAESLLNAEAIDGKAPSGVCHFVGPISGSSNVRTVLVRLCREAQELFRSGSTARAELDDFATLLKTNALARLLSEAVARAPPLEEGAEAPFARVVVVIDALNQLDVTDDAHALHWLPETVPDGVVFVVSSLEGPCLDALRARSDTAVLGISSLSQYERRAIVRAALGAYGKRLDEGVPEAEEASSDDEEVTDKKDDTRPSLPAVRAQTARPRSRSPSPVGRERPHTAHELSPGSSRRSRDTPAWSRDRSQRERDRAALLVKAYGGPVVAAPRRSAAPQPDARVPWSIVGLDAKHARRPTTELAVPRGPMSQMDLLLSKTDAGLPLYLSVACEELRLFGNYEKLTHKINVLKPTVGALLGQVLSRLEATHGGAVVRDALSFLACSRRGLRIEDLRRLLARHAATPVRAPSPTKRPGSPTSPTPRSADFRGREAVISDAESSDGSEGDGQSTRSSDVDEKDAVVDLLPMPQWLPLELSLGPFLKTTPTSDGHERLTFFHRQLLLAARQRYLAPCAENCEAYSRGDDCVHVLNPPHDSPDNRYHVELADYFCDMREQVDDANGNAPIGWRGVPAWTMADAFHHSLVAGLWAQAASLLTDIEYVDARCAGGDVDSLAEDYWRARCAFGTRHATSSTAGDGHTAHRRRKRPTRTNNRLETTTSSDRSQRVRFAEGSSLGETPSALSGNKDEAHASLGSLVSLASLGAPTGASSEVRIMRRLIEFHMFFRASAHLFAAPCPPGRVVNVALNMRSVASEPCRAARRLDAAGALSDTTLWRHVWGPRDDADHPCTAVLGGHKGSPLTCVGVSADTSSVASGTRDGTVRVFDVRTGRTRCILTGHEGAVQTVAFSPDGTHVASGSWDGTVRYWRAQTGRCVSVMRGHADIVWSVAFAPDGLRLASVGADSVARLWIPATGQCYAVLEGHDHAVVSLAVLSHGKQLVTCSVDNTMRVWDMTAPSSMTKATHSPTLSRRRNKRASSSKATMPRSGTQSQQSVEVRRAVAVLNGHEGTVNRCVAFAHGRKLLSCASDGTLRLWLLAHTGRSAVAMTGHTADVNWCDVSPDESLFVSGADDGTVRVWAADTCACLATIAEHSEGARVRFACFVAGGLAVASFATDGTTHVYTTPSRHKSSRAVAAAHGNAHAHAHAQPPSISLSDSRGNRALSESMSRSTASINSPQQSPLSKRRGSDGLSLDVNAANKARPSSPQPPGHPMRAYSGHIGASKCASVGDLVASIGTDDVVRIWEPTHVVSRGGGRKGSRPTSPSASVIGVDAMRRTSIDSGQLRRTSIDSGSRVPADDRPLLPPACLAPNGRTVLGRSASDARRNSHQSLPALAMQDTDNRLVLVEEGGTPVVLDVPACDNAGVVGEAPSSPRPQSPISPSGSTAFRVLAVTFSRDGNHALVCADVTTRPAHDGAAEPFEPALRRRRFCVCSVADGQRTAYVDIESDENVLPDSLVLAPGGTAVYGVCDEALLVLQLDGSGPRSAIATLLDPTNVGADISRAFALPSTSRWENVGLERPVRLRSDPRAVSEDGNAVACVDVGTSKASGALVWTVSRAEAVMLYGHEAPLVTCAFVPDAAEDPRSAVVLTSATDGTARLWDAGAGVCLYAFAGLSGPALCVDFRSDAGGPRALVCCSPGEAILRIWACAQRRRPSRAAGNDELVTLHMPSDRDDGTPERGVWTWRLDGAAAVALARQSGSGVCAMAYPLSAAERQRLARTGEGSRRKEPPMAFAIGVPHVQGITVVRAELPIAAE